MLFPPQMRGDSPLLSSGLFLFCSRASSKFLGSPGKRGVAEIGEHGRRARTAFSSPPHVPAAVATPLRVFPHPPLKAAEGQALNQAVRCAAVNGRPNPAIQSSKRDGGQRRAGAVFPAATRVKQSPRRHAGSATLHRESSLPLGRFLPNGRDSGGAMLYTRRRTWRQKVCMTAVSVAAVPRRDSGRGGVIADPRHRCLSRVNRTPYRRQLHERNLLKTMKTMLRSIPRATMVVVALLVLTIESVSGQTTVVDICDRTPEVQDAILNETGGTCATVTATQLASITRLAYSTGITGYSSASIVSSDFAGLTGLTVLRIINSPMLTTVPANAFSEVSNLETLDLWRNAITDVQIGAFNGLSRITHLLLHDNFIETLEPHVFNGLTRLWFLELSNNHIQTLEAGIFDDLPRLYWLYLKNNRLQRIDNAVFSGLSALYSLNLSINQLSELKANTFNGLSNLRTLLLQENSFTELPADIFAGLGDRLETLALSSDGLSTLPAGIFAGLTSLKTLNLNYNNLSSLDADIFAGLINLDFLYLNHNSLSSLDADIFAGLTKLRRLYLNHNNLSSLDADIFDGLTRLWFLDLSHNSLSSLPADIFAGVTRVVDLDLSHNTLSSLPADIFDEFFALLDLDLSHNTLSSLPADIFDEFFALLDLDLSHNTLSSLPADIFAGHSIIGIGVYELDLSHNSLSSLPADIFAGLDGMGYLDLGHNTLSSLPADIFAGLIELERLYLNHNSLSSLDADIFAGLIELERLYLNHNSLSSLPATIFADLESLWHLVLTKTTLATLPENIFAGLTDLQSLDLSCNALTALPLARFDPFASSLTYLDVSGNSYGSTPTDMDLEGQFDQITAMSGLDTGANTDCHPAYESGLNDLSLSLSTGTGTPTFMAPGLYIYSIIVDDDVSSTTVTVTPKDSRATIEPRSGSYLNTEPIFSAYYFYDNDDDTPGLQVDLTHRRTNIGWNVRVRNGSFVFPYHIAVYRDPPSSPSSEARLDSLALSGVPLTEPFDGDTRTYTATAAASVTETTVTATPRDPTATTMIKLDGVANADGTVALALGANVITVEVTAQDGTTMRTYTVTVTGVAANDTQETASNGDPLTARFTNVPGAHDGETAFTVEIVFSEAPAGMNNGALRAALQVTGGAVTQVRRVNLDRAHRIVTVRPDGGAAVTIALPGPPGRRGGGDHRAAGEPGLRDAGGAVHGRRASALDRHRGDDAGPGADDRAGPQRHGRRHARDGVERRPADGALYERAGGA